MINKSKYSPQRYLLNALLIQLLAFSIVPTTFCSKLTAQCLDTITLNTPNNICQSEAFEPLSIDTSFHEYKWIFNPANINSTATYSSLGNFGNNLNNITNGLSIYQENGNYFGFVKLNNAQGLKRLDFGPSLDSIPNVNNIYVPPFSGNSASSISDVEVLKINDQWFGFTPANLNSRIIRYNFGDSLNSDSVSVTDLPNLSGQLNLIFDLEAILFEDSLYLLAASYSNNRVVIYNMGVDPNNNSPIWYKTINLSSITPSTYNASGITGFISCKKKIVFCTGGASDNVLRLDFGNSFQNTPAISQINSSQVDYPIAPTLLFDNGYPELFVKSRSSSMNLTKFSFTDSIDQPDSTVVQSTFNSNNYPMFGFAMEVLYAEDAAYVFVVPGSGSSTPGILQKMRFPHNPVGSENTSYLNQAQIIIDSLGKHYYSLQTKDSLGTILFRRDSITVNPTPILSMELKNLCFNDTTTFKAVDSLNLSGTSWQWNLGSIGGTTLSDSAFIQYADTGIKTVSLIGIAGTCGDTIIDSFRIFDLPVASFSIDSSCQNQTLFISQNSQLSIFDSNATFEWLFSDDTLYGNNPSYSFADTGTKNIHLKIQTSNQCKSSSQLNVFIKQNPISSFSIENTCLNDTTQFTNLSSASIAFNSLWDFGDGDSSLLLNPAHVYSDTGVYEINMITTASNGCSDTTIVNHVISNKPALNLSFSENTICQAQQLEFVNNTLFEDTINYEFLVLGNDTIDLFQNNFSIPFAGNSTTIYSVSTGSSCLVDTSFNIHINPKPSIEIIIDTLCQAQLADFHSNISLLESQQINTYSWKVDDIATSMDSTLLFIPGQSTNYDIELTITTDSGCTSTQDTSIYVKAKPSVNFNFSSPVCSNVFFENNTTIEIDSSDMILSEQWYLSTPLLDTFLFPSADSIMHHSSILATVGTKITTSNGCMTDTSLQVSIKQSPIVSVERDTFCAGNFVSLSPNLSGSNYDFKWLFEDGSIKTQSSISHIFIEPGIPKLNLQVRDKESTCASEIEVDLYVTEPLSINIQDSLLCPNSLSQISADISLDSLDSIFFYRWKVNGVLFSSDSVLVFSPYEEDNNLTLETSSRFGCTSVISKNLKTIDFKKPSIDMDQSYGKIPFELNASAVSDGFSSIYWLLGNDTVANSEQLSFTIDQELNTQINLIVIDSNNCSFGTSRAISAYNGLIDLSINSINIEREDYSSFTVGFSNLGNVPIYEFDFAISDLNGLERIYSVTDTLNVGRSINIPVTDLYSNSGQDYALCASLLRIAFLEDDNIENNIFCNDQRAAIHCFPNPTENKVNLRFNNYGTDLDFTIEVYDSNGKLLSTESHLFEKGFHQKSVDLSDFKKGIYSVVLKSSTMYRHFKVVKI